MLFGRRYSLIVGPFGEKGVLIENLRITFNIEKTLETFPNSSTIEITNLGKQTLSRIEEDRTGVILNVGYGMDALKTLFIGDVNKVSTKQTATETATTIESGDGQSNFSDTHMDQSFSPGARFTEVLRAVADGLGLPIGESKGINEGDTFENGIALSGSVRGHLDTLMQRQGLEWSIQDRKLQILPQNTATNDAALLINSRTGLVGRVNKTQVLKRNPLNVRTAFKDDSGVSIVMLLNPAVYPGRLIKLESESVSGQYRVKKVNHVGDTHGNDWYTKVEAG